MLLIKNPVFDLFFGWITNSMNIFVILIIITTLLLLEEKKREWVFPLWASLMVSIAIAFAIKLIISRPRPMELPHAFLSTLNFSFPSMHTMVAFAALPILNKEFADIKWFWILFASLVAFSRVYLNFHFLSDVVFGAFLGYFIGVFIIHMEEKYNTFKFLNKTK
ncbi:MAG: phosphatase PAP2 family protein [Nanoarchaeota archaeon]|nr:phosphatase PAP2 family protein [Nanoarchaeota archaeon]